METADAGESILHDGGFSSELRIVGEVLPLASGALTEIGARRFNAVVGRGQDVGNLGGDVPASDGGYLGLNALAGDAAEDEHGAPVVNGHGLTQASPREEIEFEDVAALQGRGVRFGGGSSHAKHTTIPDRIGS